ncbi:hypothetical protein D3C85_1673590 [compost metagenome]
MADGFARMGGDQHALAKATAAAHGVEHLEPTHVRQAVVENQQVRSEAATQGNGTVAIAGDADLVTLGAQIGADVLGQGWLVFDHQNLPGLCRYDAGIHEMHLC